MDGASRCSEVGGGGRKYLSLGRKMIVTRLLVRLELATNILPHMKNIVANIKDKTKTRNGLSVSGSGSSSRPSRDMYLPT